jgi:hypothetical protein
VAESRVPELARLYSPITLTLHLRRSECPMTVTLTAPRTSLSHVAAALARVTRRVDHRAELIAELQTARLVPAVFLPGIEHQDAGEIVRTGLQGVVYQRRTLHRHINEHLFLDVAARTGVRVMACWDDRARRGRMHVAEVGEPGLWDRVVVHFTQLEMHGHPAPATAAAS